MALTNTPTIHTNHLSIPFIVLFLLTSIIGLSQTNDSLSFQKADGPVILTKEMKSATLTFKYPDDWALKKETLEFGFIYSITPVPMQHQFLQTFQIHQVQKTGFTFNTFTSTALEQASRDNEGQVKIINRRKATFKNNEALYFQVLYPEQDPVLSSVYCVKGKQFYYMIIILSKKEKNAGTLEMDRTTNMILQSIIPK